MIRYLALNSAAVQFVRAVLARDGKFLAITLSSCAVAAVVAMFQYSVYTSFLRASAVVPRMLGGDVWVTAATVESFDFPYHFNEDYVGALARYWPEAKFRRVIFGFATWRSPTGRRGNVAVVGIDDSGLPDDGFAADRTDLTRLNLREDAPGDAQLGSISDTTLHLARTVDTLPTFLGAPYVIVPFERARELLGMDQSSTSFLVGDVPGGVAGIAATRQQASRAFPEIALLTADEFADSSAAYWQRKTGAGMAILLAAVLAALLMVILLSNGVLRFIQRYHHDLVSMLGHGASQREITAIVAMIATIIAAVTSIAALAATPAMIALFKPLLPWVSFRIVDTLVPLLAVLGALGAALLSARHAIADFAPDVVFRS
jgi:hypothetical protein